MNTQISSSTLPAASSDGPVLDVRPIPCRVKHAQIFQRWSDLPVGDSFILLNDHDPVPLRYQFEAEYPQAFSWAYLERGPEDFRVKITKLKAIIVTDAPLCSASPCAEIESSARGVIQLDVRGLEPPEPLIRILGALESLPAGTSLQAQTDREPCHLFGEATHRGFRHECRESPDGSWLTILTHA